MNTTKKLIALRGACQSENSGEDIICQVCTLYDELLNRNNLSEDDIVSIIFSLTPDLDEKNPAAALRQGGKAKDLALFAVQEAAVKGSLERCIRILIHAYMDEGKTLHHIYRNGAEVLRPDRLK